MGDIVSSKNDEALFEYAYATKQNGSKHWKCWFESFIRFLMESHLLPYIIYCWH